MKTQKQDVKESAIDALRDGVGEGHGSDLHHHLFNEDYFIVGTYQATQWLGEDAFEAIGRVKDYEMDNFGEVTTDLSNPERVANMLAYILGEEILQESETLREKWDKTLDNADLKAIAEELKANYHEKKTKRTNR
tara:strand:+ start:164 stop:568 length:405 start_codon:yes stop_codon:yes gene_type:complete